MEFIFYHPNSVGTFFLNEGVAMRSMLLTGNKITVYSELGTIIDDYLHYDRLPEMYRICLLNKLLPEEKTIGHKESWEEFMKGLRALRSHKHLPKQFLINKQQCEASLKAKLDVIYVFLKGVITSFQAAELIELFKDNTITAVCSPRHFSDEKMQHAFMEHLTASLIAYDKLLVMPSEFYQEKDQDAKSLNLEEIKINRRDFDETIGVAFTELYKIPNLSSLTANQLRAATADIAEHIKPMLDKVLEYKKDIEEKNIELVYAEDNADVRDEMFDELGVILQEKINTSTYFQHIINKSGAYPETTVCVGSTSFKELVYMYYHLRYLSFESALSVLNALSKHRNVEDTCVILFHKTNYTKGEYMRPKDMEEMEESKGMEKTLDEKEEE